MKKCSQFKILEDFFMMKANKKYQICLREKSKRIARLTKHIEVKWPKKVDEIIRPYKQKDKNKNCRMLLFFFFFCSMEYGRGSAQNKDF